MPVTTFTAQLSEKASLGEKFLFLQFELLEPHRIEFTAGQYILLNVPTTAQKKAYSIVSAPRLDHAVQLLVELIPGGHASTYFSNLNVGEKVSFMAPVGEFTIKDGIQEVQTPLVFVGIGSGLAPLRSMILDQLRTRDTKRQIKLHWGMHGVDDLFWLDYFEEIHKNYPNFSYDITLSHAPDGWKLCRGRVTNCLTIHELFPEAHYYLCGNPQMIADVTQVLIGRGVAVGNIYHEKFTT